LVARSRHPADLIEVSGFVATVIFTERLCEMTHDDMKRQARRSLDMWASGAADVSAEVFAPNYVNHQEPLAAGDTAAIGLAGWRAVVADNQRGFSDFRVDILMQIAEGDRVATRWRFSATHTGDYLGHPATGRRATWTGVQIDRFANGRIVESWVDWDKYRLSATLGFLE